MMKNHRIAAAGLGLALTLLMPGVGRAQNREHQQMAAEVRMMQEQTQQLAQAIQQAMSRMNELGESVKQLGESVKKIDARLEAAEGANRKTLADQKLSFDGLSTDMRIVREGTQSVNVRIGLINEELQALRMALPALTSAQTAANTAATTTEGGAVSVNLPAAGGPPATPTTPPAPRQRTGLSASRLFQMAMADYAAGEYRLAISGFQTLLSEWGTSEQADDAQFYIGSSYLNQGRNQEAVKAFTDLVETYPNGDKAPDGYFYLGTAYRALGQNDAARTAWETVIKKYPSSSSAIIAQTKLDGLPPVPAPPKP